MFRAIEGGRVAACLLMQREIAMCKANDGALRAFWSIDAAFALVLAVAMFAMFSSLLYSAGIASAKGADETSGALLSARFSSYALSLMKDGNLVDLHGVLERTSREYASLRTADIGGDLAFSSAGEEPGEIYCTARIAWMDGKMMRLEACIG